MFFNLQIFFPRWELIPILLRNFVIIISGIYLLLFSICWYQQCGFFIFGLLSWWIMHTQLLSFVWLFATPWTGQTLPRLDSWVGKISWRRKWQPTPVFCLGNPMDRGAWWATVHGVEEFDMIEQLKSNSMLSIIEGRRGWMGDLAKV